MRLIDVRYVLVANSCRLQSKNDMSAWLECSAIMLCIAGSRKIIAIYFLAQSYCKCSTFSYLKNRVRWFIAQ